MKKTVITAGVILITSSLILAERLHIHVTTLSGDDLSGVDVRVVEDCRISKQSGTDGLIILESKTDKFQDIHLVIKKLGWSVVEPVASSIIPIDYRKKHTIIEIRMQQTEEMERQLISSAHSQMTPNMYSTGSFSPKAVSTVARYAPNLQTESTGLTIQIKSSISPIDESELLRIQRLLGVDVILVVIPSDAYQYKYRISVHPQLRDEVYAILERVKQRGFSDAFVVR
jgi:hypothetical protein